MTYEVLKPWYEVLRYQTFESTRASHRGSVKCYCYWNEMHSFSFGWGERAVNVEETHQQMLVYYKLINLLSYLTFYDYICYKRCTAMTEYFFVKLSNEAIRGHASPTLCRCQARINRGTSQKTKPNIHSKNERFFGDLKQVFQLALYREPILGLWKTLQLVCTARFHGKPQGIFITWRGFQMS